jgi:hypothetical protein
MRVLKYRISNKFKEGECAQGRNRTGTTRKGQRILSPQRLPIPPPEQELKQWYKMSYGII